MSEESSSFLTDDLTRLWQEGLGGNAAVYEESLRQLTRILRAYLRSRLPLFRGMNEELMEDLVQDVLISIHSKRQTYRQGSPLLPWVFAIAKHRLIDYLRMMKVRPNTISLFDDESGWDLLEGKVSLQREEEQRQAEMEIESRQELLTLVESLSPQQKEVLKQAKLENKPLQEIADSMQLSLANVKVTVHRAVKRLQETQKKKEKRHENA